MLLPTLLLIFLLASPSLCVEETYLGKFEFPLHGVQGELFALGPRRMRARRFYYDGEGPRGVRLVALRVGEGDAKADYHKVSRGCLKDRSGHELMLPRAFPSSPLTS